MSKFLLKILENCYRSSSPEVSKQLATQFPRYTKPHFHAASFSWKNDRNRPIPD